MGDWLTTRSPPAGTLENSIRGDVGEGDGVTRILFRGAELGTSCLVISFQGESQIESRGGVYDSALVLFMPLGSP